MNKLLAMGMVLLLSATVSAASIVGGSFVLEDAELLTTASDPNVTMTDVSGNPGVEFFMGANLFTADLTLGTIPSGLSAGLDWTLTVENTGDRVVQMATISQSGPSWTWVQSTTVDIDPATTVDVTLTPFDSSDLKALKLRFETSWWEWMGGNSVVTVVPTPIPEPAALTLCGLLAACGLAVRRKRLN